MHLFYLISSNEGGPDEDRLNSIISPGQRSALGPLPTQPLTGIKM